MLERDFETKFTSDTNPWAAASSAVTCTHGVSSASGSTCSVFSTSRHSVCSTLPAAGALPAEVGCTNGEFFAWKRDEAGPARGPGSAGAGSAGR
mgnify:CR=1 FL=1